MRIPPLVEFRIAQEIRVYYEGKEFPIWAMSKRDLGEYGEMNGKPRNLHCEITDEIVLMEDFDDLFGTSCKWDSIEKQGEK